MQVDGRWVVRGWLVGKLMRGCGWPGAGAMAGAGGGGAVPVWAHAAARHGVGSPDRVTHRSCLRDLLPGFLLCALASILDACRMPEVLVCAAPTYIVMSRGCLRHVMHGVLVCMLC